MSSEAHWQRAALLFDQQRWDLAIQELRAVLTDDPEHPFAHALLTQALAATDKIDEALAEARHAVGLAPDEDFTHFALGVVHRMRGEFEPAAAAVLRAIELDPDDVGSRAMLAQVRLHQRRWEAALEAADAGLALDPEHTDCLNARALALTKLGRGAEATDSVDASLAHDPDNPYTHQTRGFALLQRGDAEGALRHFQEALRRDPTLDGARAGLVEALKARNPFYRLVLGWFLWLDRFSGAQQLQIAFGMWLGARFGAQALEGAGAGVAADVVRWSWFAFVLLTACTVPIFNLLLLLHPIGRHALERRARFDAIVLGLGVAAAIGIGLTAAFAEQPWARGSWFFWLVFLLPLSGIGLFQPGWGRVVLQCFCCGCLAFWAWWCIRVSWPPMQMRDGGGGWSSLAPPPIEWWREMAAMRDTLVLTVALSTWFVLLTPKGRRRARRKSA